MIKLSKPSSTKPAADPEWTLHELTGEAVTDLPAARSPLSC
jgi:hypothetical protein